MFPLFQFGCLKLYVVVCGEDTAVDTTLSNLKKLLLRVNLLSVTLGVIVFCSSVLSQRTKNPVVVESTIVWLEAIIDGLSTKGSAHPCS
jgi:hypothetical protein